MNSFELSKIFGPLFAAVLFILVMHDVTAAIFSSGHAETPGYIIEVTESSGSDDDEEKVDEALLLLASADAAKGESVAKKCSACHSFDQGGANKVGPNLWGVVNQTIGSHDGFKYSAALASIGGEGQTWNLENLSAFLLKPKAFAKGTSMGFAGLKKPADRANMIAYLNSLSENPSALEVPAAE